VGAGNIEMSPLLCGISAGGVKERMTCKEIIEEIVSDGRAKLETAPKLVD
jgi:hypothetical protein